SRAPPRVVAPPAPPAPVPCDESPRATPPGSRGSAPARDTDRDTPCRCFRPRRAWKRARSDRCPCFLLTRGSTRVACVGDHDVFVGHNEHGVGSASRITPAHLRLTCPRRRGGRQTAPPRSAAPRDR